MPPTTLSRLKSLVEPFTVDEMNAFPSSSVASNRYPISTSIVFVQHISQKLEFVYSKKSNREIPRRRLKVSDHTFDSANCSVVLWQEKAECDVSIGDVVLVQNAYARFNPFKSEMEISVSGGERTIFRTIVNRG